MAKVTISQIADLSQELSINFMELNNLTSKAWLQHELVKSQMEEITDFYKEFAKQNKGMCASSRIKNVLNEFFGREE